MDKLKFDFDGVPAEVSYPSELNFQKTLTGNYEAICPCGAGKINVTKEDLEAGLDQHGWKSDENKELVEYHKSYPSPLTEVLKSKKANGILQKAPMDNLLKFMREFHKYE